MLAGSQRLLVEAHVDFFQRSAQAGFADLFDRVEGDGGHVVLQPLQLDDELRRQNVGPCARDLPQLDEARAEVLQHQAGALVDGDPALLLLALFDFLVGNLGRLAGRPRLEERTVLGAAAFVSARNRRGRRSHRSRGARERWKSRADAQPDRGPR